MQKISHAEVSQVLSEVPGVIRALVERNEVLETKVAAMERRERVEKVAEAMHAKGIDDTPMTELVERLEKAAEQGKLATIEEAVDLYGPNMSEKIAQVSGEKHAVSGGSSDLERFIAGEVG